MRHRTTERARTIGSPGFAHACAAFAIVALLVGCISIEPHRSSTSSQPGAASHAAEAHYAWIAFTDGHRRTCEHAGQPCPHLTWRDRPERYLRQIIERLRSYRNKLMASRGHGAIDIVVFTDTLCGRRVGYVPMEICSCAPSPRHVEMFFEAMDALDAEFARSGGSLRLIPYTGPHQSIHRAANAADQPIDWTSDNAARRAFVAEIEPFARSGLLVGVGLDSSSGHRDNFYQSAAFIRARWGVPAIAEALLSGSRHERRPPARRHYRELIEGDVSHPALQVGFQILTQVERARENGRVEGWEIPAGAAPQFALLHSDPAMRATDHPTGTDAQLRELRELGFILVPKRLSDDERVAAMAAEPAAHHARLNAEQ